MGHETEHAPSTGWTEDVRVDAERRRDVLHATEPATPPASTAGASGTVPHTTTSNGAGARSTRGTRGLGVADALLRGAAAGALGALAMTLTHRGVSTAVLPAGASMPDPGAQVADELAARRDAELSGAQAAAAGAGISLAYGALLGAVYGVVQSRLHPPDLLHGLALAGLSYAVTVPERGVLPRLGVQPPPALQSLDKTAVSVSSHVAFGITTAAAFEALS